MAIATFNKKYFFRLLGYSMEDAQIADQTTKIGMEAEEITKDEIILNILPNRPDLLDAVGFARSLKNFMHKSRKFDYSIAENKIEYKIKLGKEIREIRPFIAALVVKNLQLDKDSLKNLLDFTNKLTDTFGRKRKKVAIGIHDLKSVEKDLEYNAYKNEDFIPLNSKKKMSFKEIVETHEKGKEYGGAISKSNLYPAIKDKKGILALIPIVNSERTKVTEITNSLLIDVTGTNEFEVNKAADILACSFLDLDAKVEHVEIIGEKRILTPTMKSDEISIPIKQIEANIGVLIGNNNALSLAEKMGYRAALISNSIRFKAPVYRTDIINDQDIVEDIAIAYGYDFIQPIPIFSTTQGELEERTVNNRKASLIMLGLGFSEMMNSYLTNEKINFADMLIDETYRVEIKDSKTSSITMARTWLLPSILKNLSMSANEKMPQKVFEIDMTFNLKNKKPTEEYHICAATAGPKANFNEIKAHIESLLKNLQMEYKIESKIHKSFIEGRCASIKVNGKEIGFFGEIHPQILKNFSIEEPISAFEIII